MDPLFYFFTGAFFAGAFFASGFFFVVVEAAGFAFAGVAFFAGAFFAAGFAAAGFAFAGAAFFAGAFTGFFVSAFVAVAALLFVVEHFVAMIPPRLVFCSAKLFIFYCISIKHSVKKECEKKGIYFKLLAAKEITNLMNALYECFN